MRNAYYSARCDAQLQCTLATTRYLGVDDDLIKMWFVLYVNRFDFFSTDQAPQHVCSSSGAAACL